VTAAARLAAYEAAVSAHGAAVRAKYAGAGHDAEVAETAETLRLAFAAWTSAPDDGTVTPDQIRNARAAGAAKRSRELRSAGRR
jgi:hypothetical protein